MSENLAHQVDVVQRLEDFVMETSSDPSPLVPSLFRNTPGNSFEGGLAQFEFVRLLLCDDGVGESFSPQYHQNDETNERPQAVMKEEFTEQDSRQSIQTIGR